MTAKPELIGGPYEPPKCTVGSWLDDEIDGALQVGGWTNAPITWPRRKKTGRHSLILCGDLVRAVRTESSEAVQHWWGVGPVTVAKWRRALGVDTTIGTDRLRKERHPGSSTQGRVATKAARLGQARQSVDARRNKTI